MDGGPRQCHKPGFGNGTTDKHRWTLIIKRILLFLPSLFGVVLDFLHPVEISVFIRVHLWFISVSRIRKGRPDGACLGFR